MTAKEFFKKSVKAGMGSLAFFFGAIALAIVFIPFVIVRTIQNMLLAAKDNLFKTYGFFKI